MMLLLVVKNSFFVFIYLQGTLGTFTRASTRIPHQNNQGAMTSNMCHAQGRASLLVTRTDSAKTAHWAVARAVARKNRMCPNLGQLTPLLIALTTMREPMSSCSRNNSRYSSRYSSQYNNRYSSLYNSHWNSRNSNNSYQKTCFETGLSTSAHRGRSTTTTARLRYPSGRSRKIGTNTTQGVAMVAVALAASAVPAAAAVAAATAPRGVPLLQHQVFLIPAGGGPSHALKIGPQLLWLHQHRRQLQLARLPLSQLPTAGKMRSIPLLAATLWCLVQHGLTNSLQQQGIRMTLAGLHSRVTKTLGKMHRHRTWIFPHRGVAEALQTVRLNQAAASRSQAPQCFCPSHQ
ncbi:hypothetical protein V5799_025124 [Amblyomma americanum]|uniref:Secreted protein n=1 Tax=Amblyomma americanum TaxID=6943 RepID=A0AAQ4EAG4_AMBAM